MYMVSVCRLRKVGQWGPNSEEGVEATPCDGDLIMSHFKVFKPNTQVLPGMNAQSVQMMLQDEFILP